MSEGVGTTKRGICPICKAETTENYRPFCSKRCADIDLGRWINGAYAIPSTNDDDEDGTNSPPHEDGQEPPEA